MDVGLLGQYVANGLMLGVIYAMVAVGFTLFFGVLDIIQFSHGDVLTVGAFTGLATFVALQTLGVASPWLQLVFIVFPFVGVWITHGWTRALHGETITILLLIFAGAAREQKVPAWYGIGFPLGALMFLAVIWNATIYALRHDGIDWRGTHYPLAALKANRV